MSIWVWILAFNPIWPVLGFVGGCRLRSWTSRHTMSFKRLPYGDQRS